MRTRQTQPDRRSLASSNLAIAAAGGFLVLAALLSFVPDARPDPVAIGESWQLRGTLAPGHSAPGNPAVSIGARHAESPEIPVPDSGCREQDCKGA